MSSLRVTVTSVVNEINSCGVFTFFPNMCLDLHLSECGEANVILTDVNVCIILLNGNSVVSSL